MAASELSARRPLRIQPFPPEKPHAFDLRDHIGIFLALATPFQREGGVFDTAMEFIDSRELKELAARAGIPVP